MSSISSIKPNLGHVILYVEDVDRAQAFYTDVMGIPVKMKMGKFVEMDTGATKLAFVERKFINEEFKFEVGAPSTGASEISLVVPWEQVEELHQKAVAGGAKSILVPTQKPWGFLCYVRDLDGHLIEITCLSPPMPETDVKADAGAA